MSHSATSPELNGHELTISIHGGNSTYICNKVIYEKGATNVGSGGSKEFRIIFSIQAIIQYY